MRHLKAVVLTCTFLFALGAFAAQAQGGQDDKDKREHAQKQMPSVDDHVKELTEKLNLNADQQAKARSMLEVFHQQSETISKDNSLSREEKRAKLRTAHESAKSKFREILNDDQKQKFDAMDKEMQEHRHGPEGKGGESSPK